MFTTKTASHKKSFIEIIFKMFGKHSINHLALYFKSKLRKKKKKKKNDEMTYLAVLLRAGLVRLNASTLSSINHVM